ncbi:hypothetical protein [Sinorhizobium meliloti]|uniref:hypothetical protein n=1 Tax=Rhizobium meliloti TaxID=382 RepID=UPI0012972665|nr:hypothetical protein [Sinorhizobium meliloti]MQX90524.1 hypothetical protein [Sinorhizobium meliloti]
MKVSSPNSRHLFDQLDVLADHLSDLASSDNISEGELLYVRDDSEYGTMGLTENSVEELQNLLADIRTWDGGIRRFLVD